MPTFNGTNPVSVGLATKADHFNRVFDNTVVVREGGIALAGQVAGDLPVASSSTQYERLVGSSKTANLQDAVLQRPELKDYAETVTSPAIAAGALTLNLESGNVFTVALNANVTTFAISNPPASGKCGSVTLILTADGTARTITWPAAVKWPSGTAPTLTSTNGKKDVLMFVTTDGGATYFACVAGQNF